MLLWCLEPYMTSSRMHLGNNDGLINVITQCSIWGIPISLAVLLQGFRGFKELASGMIIGALIYIPFELYEMRPARFAQAAVLFCSARSQPDKAAGRFPSMVFMQSGLALASSCHRLRRGMWDVVERRNGQKNLNMPMSVVMPVLFIGHHSLPNMAAIAFFCSQRWRR